MSALPGARRPSSGLRIPPRRDRLAPQTFRRLSSCEAKIYYMRLFVIVNSFLRCPPDMTKPLPIGSSSVYVMFPQPKTNVDWFRCRVLEIPVLHHIDDNMGLSLITCQICGGGTLLGEAAGRRDDPGEEKDSFQVQSHQSSRPLILFKLTQISVVIYNIAGRASSPVTNQSATCSFNIHIKVEDKPIVKTLIWRRSRDIFVQDNEPPRVARCPASFAGFCPEIDLLWWSTIIDQSLSKSQSMIT